MESQWRESHETSAIKKLGFKTQYLNINNDQIIKNPIEYQLKEREEKEDVCQSC